MKVTIFRSYLIRFDLCGVFCYFVKCTQHYHMLLSQCAARHYQHPEDKNHTLKKIMKIIVYVYVTIYIFIIFIFILYMIILKRLGQKL